MGIHRRVCHALHGLAAALLPAVCLSANSFGDWVLGDIDRMTGKQSCAIRNTANRQISFQGNRLYVNYRGRGGMARYQYRLDEAEASNLFTAGDMRSDSTTVEIMNWKDENLLAGKRLFVRAWALTGGVVEDDINLAGLQSATAALPDHCKQQ